MIIAFIDTETTGLKPGVNRVVEAALQVVSVTAAGMDVRGTQTLRQRVDLTTTPWNDKALEINGYCAHDTDWKTAPLAGSREARGEWFRYANLLKGAILCSSNVPFDRDFIAAELDYFGIKPEWDRRVIELYSFSALVAIKLGLPQFGLHAVYEALGGPKLQEHRAMADVGRGMFLFEKVARSYFTE